MSANGNLLEEVLAILREDRDIPENVTNKIIFVAQVHFYRKMEDIEKRVVELEQDVRKTVTWPYVLKTFGIPVVLLVMGYLFSLLIH